VIPHFLLRVQVEYPSESVNYRIVVEHMRDTVKALAVGAVKTAQQKAPGTRLKTQIGQEYQDTPKGGEGVVWMPYQLRFTLPPGTRKHFIPGGLAVNSYGAAAAIQLAKGYPLRFYSEKLGGIVFRWSVFHPGYKGSDWGERVMADVDNEVQAAMEEISQFIGWLWGRK